jgi:head-tail adaptor
MSGEFAGSLRERVTIERQVPARNAMGLQEYAWEPLCRCLASVLPDGVGAEAEGQALSAMPRFRVTIRSRDQVGIDQRVAWKGRVLMVRQIVADPRTPDRIAMRCEEVRQ